MPCRRPDECNPFGERIVGARARHARTEADDVRMLCRKGQHAVATAGDEQRQAGCDPLEMVDGVT